MFADTYISHRSKYALYFEHGSSLHFNTSSRVVPGVALFEPKYIADSLRLVVVRPQQKHVLVVENHAGRLGKRVHPAPSRPHETAGEMSRTRTSKNKVTGR